MDTKLLERARRLNAAAHEMAGQLNASVSPDEPVARETATTGTASANTSPKRSPLKPSLQVDAGSGKGEGREFRGAAFSGSSLLTTYADLRPFLSKGDAFFVDDVLCMQRSDGELSASRVELAEDFRGPTNIDAVIRLQTVTKRKQRAARPSMQPVASEDIRSATSQLDSVLGLLPRPAPAKRPTKKSVTVRSSIQPVSDETDGTGGMGDGEGSSRVPRASTSRGSKSGTGKLRPTSVANVVPSSTPDFSAADLAKRHTEMSEREVEKAAQRALDRAAGFAEQQRQTEQHRVAEEERRVHALRVKYAAKVLELQGKTEERVRQLRRDRREEERRAGASKAEEAAARLEREALARDEKHIERARALRKETEDRCCLCPYTRPLHDSCCLD